AHKLATKAKRVLLLDAGPRITPSFERGMDGESPSEMWNPAPRDASETSTTERRRLDLVASYATAAARSSPRAPYRKLKPLGPVDFPATPGNQPFKSGYEF